MTDVLPVTALGMVIDHLVLRLRTDERLPADETLVIDGPRRNNDTTQTVIIIGWIPGSERDAFEVNTREQQGIRVGEDFTINYLINTLSGEADAEVAAKIARDRALYVLGVLADILTTQDMTLDGTVGEIKLGPWSMSPFPQAKGVEVAASGTIVGRSLL